MCKTKPIFGRKYFIVAVIDLFYTVQNNNIVQRGQNKTSLTLHIFQKNSIVLMCKTVVCQYV